MDEEDDLTPRQQRRQDRRDLRKDTLLNRLEGLYGARELGTRDEFNAINPRVDRRIGRTTRRLDRLGVQFDENGNPIGEEDFKPLDVFGESGDINLAVSDEAFRNARGKYGDKAAWMERVSNYARQQQVEKSLADYRENIEPMYRDIQNKITAALNSPVLSAEELGRVRSDLATFSRGAKANNLRRVSAVLGLRGLDAGSPAGLAALSRASEEADSAFMDQVRKLGIDVQNMEDQSQSRELALAGDLATRIQAARHAGETGDFNALLEARSGLAALLESINQSNNLENLQRDQMGQARNLAWLNAAAQVTSAAVTPSGGGG